MTDPEVDKKLDSWIEVAAQWLNTRMYLAGGLILGGLLAFWAIRAMSRDTEERRRLDDVALQLHLKDVAGTIAAVCHPSATMSTCRCEDSYWRPPHGSGDYWAVPTVAEVTPSGDVLCRIPMAPKRREDGQ